MTTEEDMLHMELGDMRFHLAVDLILQIAVIEGMTKPEQENIANEDPDPDMCKDLVNEPAS